jgi:iron complex outermembrane receptor protein
VVKTLELGFKNRLLAGALNLSGAYFYSNYTDMQYASVGAIAMTDRWEALRNPDGTPILDPSGKPVMGWVVAPIVAYYTQNVPAAKIQGFELEYDWTPYPGGKLGGYGSWLRTRIAEDWITKWNYDAVAYFGINYEQSIDPTNPILKVNLKGNQLAVSPPFKLNLNYEHAFDLGRRGAIVPWVNLHWEAASYLTLWNVDKHTTDMAFVIPRQDIHFTDDKRKAFYTVDATVRYYKNDWYLEAFGYNLTNKVIQYWGGASEGVAKGSFSTPRIFGLRFQFKL